MIGAVFLAIVAAVPMIIGDLTGVSIQLGGTSLLIIVGVALDTARSLEGYMTARHHKAFGVIDQLRQRRLVTGGA